MGIFITFEGIDGCGKSTQVKLLDHVLKEKKIETCVTREPGGTEAGKIIRNILLGSEFSVDRYAQLFLFVADRAQHLE
ncbi:MAG: dTMP kinase, partial [Deltaproteobacteria bacterium]